MEFHIDMPGPIQDIEAIEHAIHGVDPAALVDVDSTGHTLRVAASVNEGQLLVLLHQVGHPVERDQVTRIASICCGGCSG